MAWIVKQTISNRFIYMIVVVSILFGLSAFAATGTPIPKSSTYPKMVRLEHGAASARGWIVATTNGNVPPTSANIFISKDDGSTFSFLSTIALPSGSVQRCCGSIFEMPRQVGSLKAGTLLYAASYTAQNNTISAIEIYASSDAGTSWTYLATPVSGGDVTKHGLWEPFFLITSDGALAMFWSDETDSCCSQKLARIRTYDGIRWRDKSNVVATEVPSDRPGMAIVSHPAKNAYFMSYEICGAKKCGVYYRTSSDGWNYGDPASAGTRVETASGEYFEHAPTNIWAPAMVSSKGGLLVVGQVFYSADGSVSPRNGRVILVNKHPDGAGTWEAIAAPVEVPGAYDNYCPNYSSALLPAANGPSLLEVTTDYDSAHCCVAYFATKRWSELAGN